MTEHYVIFSWDATMNDSEHEALYWSNSLGWVDLASADTYTGKEKNKYPFTPDDGVWVKLPR